MYFKDDEEFSLYVKSMFRRNRTIIRLLYYDPLCSNDKIVEVSERY